MRHLGPETAAMTVLFGPTAILLRRDNSDVPAGRPEGVTEGPRVAGVVDDR